MRNFAKWTQVGASDTGSTISIDASGRLATLISTEVGAGRRAYLRRTIPAVPRSVVTVRVLARNVSGAASIIFEYPAVAVPVRRTEVVSPELIEYVTSWQVPAAATTGTVVINIGVFTTQIGNCEIYDAKIEVDGVDIDTVGDWVIQPGSNANGEFVRFADGTQICWHSITRTGIDIDTSLGGVFLSDVYTWNYPATFLGAVLISPFVKNVRQSGQSANTDAFIHASESTSLMQYRHAAWAAQSGVNVRAVLYAIGRWF